MDGEKGIVVSCLQWQSPVGWLLAVAVRDRLVALSFAGDEPVDETGLELRAARWMDPGVSVRQEAPGEFLATVRKALDRYFTFSEPLPSLPLKWYRGTAFERAVWRELQRIPFGETRTYGEVAARIGRPRAARAVGGACAKNPMAIVVPCHRVVAGGGRWGGFSSGLATKRFLLRLESRGSVLFGSNTH